MRTTPLPLLGLLVFHVVAPALAEEPSLPVGIRPAGYVQLTQQEFDGAEWYQEDQSTGAKDSRIRMNCGSKALQSILPNSELPPFDKAGGYLNICVPTEKMSHTDANWKHYFAIDPPVYMHPDFNLGLNVIFPNFYGEETVYRNEFEHWSVEEKIDPVSGEHYEEITIYKLKPPKMKWTVILTDGFGRELKVFEHDLTAPQWNAHANRADDMPTRLSQLRAIPIDVLLDDTSKRYYPYRTPPLVVSAALSSTIHVDNPGGPDVGPGWDVDVYPAYGTAILQPTTGIEALPPPEDIGVFNDAGTSQLKAKWLPVDGADGYLVFSAPCEKTFFQPYDSSPFGHRGGEWFPMDVWTMEGITLLTGDSGSCDATLGYPGVPNPEDKYESYVMVVPVGPKLAPDSAYYLAGRPSKAFGYSMDGYFLTLDKDGNPRVRGPVVKSYAHDDKTHGIHEVPAGEVRSIPGAGFGTHTGELLLDGKPFPWSRVVDWTDWQLRLTAGNVPGEGTLEIRDHDGVMTKTALATIETKPSLGEPLTAYAAPGQPFLIPWNDKTPEVPPAVSVYCDLQHAPTAGQLEVDKALVNTGTGNLEVHFKLPKEGDPPYFCPCNLFIEIEAADGKAMQWPDWNGAFSFLPIPPKSHLVVRRTPKGSTFLDGTYTQALVANGVNTGYGISHWETKGDLDSGPSPVLVKDMKGLAWSFGSTARHPLTATDMAAILAVLENGGNVMLVGQFFLRELADGDPGHFGATGLKLEGYRAVQLGKQLDVPLDSPAFEVAPGGVELQEACWGMISYLPVPSEECEVVMTTKSVEGDRPAVVVCNDHLLISAVPEECMKEGGVDGWVAALKWN